MTLFLKASTKEGLIKIKEAKGGMVVTGMNRVHEGPGWFDENFATGVDGSHSSVRAHVRHVTVKDVGTHKGKQEEEQAQLIEKTEMQHRERQVTLLRKPGPTSVALFQHVGRE